VNWCTSCAFSLLQYDSKDILKERLLLALHEGATGFGFV
jgi:hypothetical protein